MERTEEVHVDGRLAGTITPVPGARWRAISVHRHPHGVRMPHQLDASTHEAAEGFLGLLAVTPPA